MRGQQALTYAISRAVTKHGARVALALLIAAITFATALASQAVTPQKAFADYENPTVTTIAQMQTDNSLHVTSQRAYVFDDQYSLITIPLSRGASESTLAMESVRCIQIGESGDIIRNWWNLEEVRFQPAWRQLYEDTEGLADRVRKAESEARERARNGSSAEDFFTLPTGDAFAFDARNDMVYVFLTPTSLNTVIEYNYTVDEAAVVYEDVAELYWDYVSPLLDADSASVNAQIQLPVPEGSAVVPGENVRAWGHGPEGTLKIEADGTVDFRVSQVAAGEFAQAHVLFPGSWLTNRPIQQKLKKNGLREEQSIAEEASWTDSYTASVVNGYALGIVQLVICILLLIGSVALYMVRGRDRKPTEDDVRAAAATLASVDPAVIGRLLRRNHWSSDDVATTLMALADKGVIAIEDVDGDARFRVTPSAKTHELSELGHATMKFVFDIVGDGYQSVSVQDIREECRKHPGIVKRSLMSWQKLLDAEVAQVGLFDKRSIRAGIRLAIVAAIVIVVGIVEWIASGSILPGCAFVLTGVAMAAVAYFVPRRTTLGYCMVGMLDESESLADRPVWASALSEALEHVMQSDAEPEPGYSDADRSEVND